MRRIGLHVAAGNAVSQDPERLFDPILPLDSEAVSVVLAIQRRRMQ
jgi:hypothetical protein